MGAILSLGFEGVPACGAPLWTLNVLRDFLLHCCIGAEQSACAGFLSFVLSPHSKDFPVLLSCSASCKFNWIFHFFEMFWDSEILLACLSSSFMWLSFKMAFAGPLWIQFYCVATAHSVLPWQVWGKTQPWVCHLCGNQSRSLGSAVYCQFFSSVLPAFVFFLACLSFKINYIRHHWRWAVTAAETQHDFSLLKTTFFRSVFPKPSWAWQVVFSAWVCFILTGPKPEITATSFPIMVRFSPAPA